MVTEMERFRLLIIVLLVSLAAWSLLALSYSGVALPDLCLSGADWFVPSADLYAAMFVFAPLTALAGGWVVMVVAMMTPLIFVPLMGVRSVSLRRMQPVVTGLFAAGYFAIWIVVGPAFLSIALTILVISREGDTSFLIALVLAAIWQASPWKQAALNGCHNRQSLAAFGTAACRDSLVAGLLQGGWCLVSCWALMLAALVVPAFHFATMFLFALFVWVERFEHPRKPEWNLNLPSRVFRSVKWRVFSGDLAAFAVGKFARNRE